MAQLWDAAGVGSGPNPTVTVMIAQSPAKSEGRLMKKAVKYPVIVAAVGILCLVAWLDDFITLHGAKTVYTADCAQGTWQGGICGGTLVAGGRYRYRVLKAHNEVLFWIAGSTEPSGKLTECVIDSAKDWSCPPNADSARTIIHAMKHGQPVVDPGKPARPFHPIPKWKWLLLDADVPYFHAADW